MRYRGGGIGHFPTRVDEPAAPPDISTESEEDPTVGGDVDAGEENEDDRDDLGSEDEDADNVEAEEDDVDEDGEEDEEDEEDDSTLQSSSIRIREELVNHLGYSEL